MRPEHRHELKTNELVEWLNNLPVWFKENRTSVILVLAVLFAAAAFYIWKSYKRNILFQQELQLTDLVGQIFGAKMEILRNREEGRDVSFMLLQPAEELKNLAAATKGNQMTALALIKRAEALRAELHYRLGAISIQELTDQINKAKESYTEALKLCWNNPSLTAKAKFGLGLCEEDLGNFDQAQQIYSDIAADPNFESTVAATQARFRLETMSEYKQQLVFKPASKPEPTTAVIGEMPLFEEPNNLTPYEERGTKVETNLPIDINPPGEEPNAVSTRMSLPKTELPAEKTSPQEETQVTRDDTNQSGK